MTRLWWVLLGLSLFLAPAEASAQCAQCKRNWLGQVFCEHCAGGTACGSSCKFDNAGNCYHATVCKAEALAGGMALEDVIQRRGVTALPAELAGLDLSTITVHEAGNGLLVSWDCQGEPSRVWRIRGSALVAEEPALVMSELARAQRRLHLHRVLGD